MLSPDQLAQVKSKFAASIADGVENRWALLDNCKDEAVRAEVLSLLSLRGLASDFLETPLAARFGEAPRQTLAAGVILEGRYRVDGVLAESGFATVYVATDRSVANKRVVVKVLDQVRSAEPQALALRAEIEALSKIHHPNVVGISDSGRLGDGTPFLVLDYVPGITLRQAILSLPPGKRIGGSRSRGIVRSIGHGLAAAHSEGICHLDLKPENIILSEPGTAEETVRLIDFGVAAVRGLVAPQAASPNYQAPEQRESPGPRSDIFSLARVAAELFGGSTTDVRPLKLWWSAGPRAGMAMLKALRADPARRQQSVLEFAGAFQRDRSVATWVSMAIAIVLGGLLAFHLFSPSKPLDLPTPTPFITSAGLDYRPSLSPDGQWLYYVSDQQGQRAIFRKPLAGGSPTRITHDDAIDDWPAVSPDGSKLAFLRIFPLEAAIVVLDLRGGGTEREVVRMRALDMAAWSADSGSLLLETTTDAGRSAISAVHIKSRQWRNLWVAGDGSQRDRRPAISPDGKQVAFIRDHNNRASDLMVAPLDRSGRPTGSPLSLLHLVDRIEFVQWAPDGRSLFYVAGPLTTGSLFRIATDGSKPSAVLPAAGRLRTISVALHSWKLAYDVDLTDVNVWQMELSRTAKRKALLTGTYQDQEAHLSPDGKWIAFASSRTGEEQIWIAAQDGSLSYQLSDFRSAEAISPLWLPDSKNLIVSVRSKDLGSRIYQTPASRSDFRELSADAFATALSADGDWLFFRSQRGTGHWEMWRMRLSDRPAAEQVTHSDGYFGLPSKDGRFLYFTKRDESEGIWRQAIASGEPARVIDSVYRRSLYAIASKGIFYIDGMPDGLAPVLVFKTFADSRSKVLHAFDRRLSWGFDLSPDEKSVLYSQYDVANSDIMLVNGFR